MFVHEDAHLITAAKTTRDAECKGSVRICHKSHIAEGAVYGIIRTVAECDLQLSRHVDLTSDGKQILCRCLRIRFYIECLTFLHAGERTHHDISRIVSTAASAVNFTCDGFLHENRNLLCFQVMELYSLAGGELHELHAIVFYCLNEEFQALFCQVSACHSETQHMF